MRNTVFKTAALAGLFLCMLALAGAFFSTTVSVHAMHEGFIHAEDVGTDEAKLKEFVEDAIDAYYIDFLIKGEEEHCDFSQLVLPQTLINLLPGFLARYDIEDLSPSSMRTLSTDDIKGLISLFNTPEVQSFIPGGLDIWEPCEIPPSSSLREVFGLGEGDWRSDSIYLFVVQYTDQEQILIYHGIDMPFENRDVTGLKDEGEREIIDLIREAADGPVQSRTEKGFLDYCWEDPSVEDDEIEDMDPLTAPGDSWKTSYVVDPFNTEETDGYLGVDSPSDSSRVIFGSGIYPKTGEPPSGCDGNGMADYDGDDGW